jgi:hypothetical protein
MLGRLDGESMTDDEIAYAATRHGYHQADR